MASGKVPQTWNESGSRYCKMPDGTLIQAGYVSVSHPSAGTINTAVQFPIAFSTQPILSISLYGTDISIEKACHASTTTTGFTLLTQSTYSGANSVGVDWIAFGRWK